MNSYWSDFLKDLTPYEAGEQPQDRSYLKLNTNESPYPPSDSVLKAIRDRTSDRLRLYPDPEATVLRQAVADYYSLRTDNVFAGNGSDEVLGFAFQAFFRNQAAILFPDITYSFYPVYCRLFDIDYRTFPLGDTFEIDVDSIPGNGGGIILANPNAPTGICVEVSAIETILKNNPASVVLIDEAYIDFGGESCIPLINRYPNLLVVQTLSKSRSLAGLRVGIALGDSGLIEGIRRVKNSFNAYPLDSLAIAGAAAAFADQAGFEQHRTRIMEARTWTVQALQQRGFDVIPSQANFIMIRHREMPAKSIYLALKENGVLVRYFDSPRIDNYLRVTIGTVDDMKTFIEILDSVVK